MEEYTNDEINARKSMYDSLLLASKCVSDLDKEKMDYFLELAEKAILGLPQAAKIFNFYKERWENRFWNKALNEAESAAESGDIKLTCYCISMAEQIGEMNVFKKMGLIKTAQENYKRRHPDDPTKILVIGKKEKECLANTKFSLESIATTAY